MNRHIHLILAGLVAGSAALAPQTATAEKPLGDNARPLYVPGEIVVKYKATTAYTTRDRITRSLGSAKGTFTLMNDTRHIRLNEGESVRAAVERLRGRPEIAFVEPVYYRYHRADCGTERSCPNDPKFPSQWALDNDGTGESELADADMDLPEAWFHETGESGDSSTSDITVAVIDDGFDLDHVDLRYQFAHDGYTCTKDDCALDPNADSQNSDETHGTQVAGAVSAEGDNTTGISGAAQQANILPLRLPELTSPAIAQGINQAVSEGADIINLSLGGPILTNAEEDAIRNARDNGVLIVAAAGNDDSNLDQSTASYPANAPYDNVLAVGATTKADTPALFSVWGSLSVDLAAPGHGVLLTQVDGGYGPTSGTSFSSPFTAGVASLVAQDLVENQGVGSIDYKDIKARLLKGAENTNDSVPNESESALTGRFSTGRVNAHDALESGEPLGTDPIMLISGISINDSATTNGDDDGEVDPGEQVNVVVEIENINHEDPSGISAFSGKLSVADSPNSSGSLSASTPTVAFTNTTGEKYRATFPMDFSDFAGHQRYLLKLEIDHGTSTFGTADETRWAWREAARLTDATTLTQTVRRSGMTTWDDFHHLHFTVPADANNLVIETSTSHDAGADADIDLIARENDTPEYAISLNPPEGQGSFFVGPIDPQTLERVDGVKLSGRFDGEESVVFDNVTQGNTYEIVVANFDQQTIDYKIRALTDASLGSFTTGAFSVTEGDNAIISVERTGSTAGPMSVDYTTRIENRLDNPASSDNFTSTSGTLQWADGESGSRSFTVETTDDSEDTEDLAFQVTLTDASGDRAALGKVTESTVTIIDSGSSGDSGDTSEDVDIENGADGGGGGGPLAPIALAMLALLGLRRRL